MIVMVHAAGMLVMVSAVITVVAAMIRKTAATSASPAIPKNAARGREQDRDSGQKKDESHVANPPSFWLGPPWGVHPSENFSAALTMNPCCEQHAAQLAPGCAGTAVG